MAQSARQVITTNLSATVGDIKDVFISRRFWLIIIALADITVLAWITLPNLEDRKPVFIPLAEEVISVADDLIIKTDFQATGDGQSFFDMQYKTLLIGKASYKSIALVGIKDGVSYSYIRSMNNELALFQGVTKVYDFYPISKSIEAEIGRDWIATWLVIIITTLGSFLLGYIAYKATE